MRLNPFLRNLAILAAVALLIVVLNQETALATASTLLRFAFFIVVGVVAYFFWRDFARREIETWPTHASCVFYAAVGLAIADLGWFLFVHPNGRDALVFFVVLGICLYVGIRTWREQKMLM